MANDISNDISVLQYRLHKKDRKIKRLKKEMEKSERWKKIDRIFWFFIGYGACAMLYSICETAANMAGSM